MSSASVASTDGRRSTSGAARAWSRRSSSGREIGATSRADTLTGTISTVVTEVLPNGDLRIEGKREVTVNSETQLMSISGIVRRVDVDTKNTVLSSAIADAKIEYSGLGVVDDVQRPGWLVRVLDWVYPF